MIIMRYKYVDVKDGPKLSRLKKKSGKEQWMAGYKHDSDGMFEVYRSSSLEARLLFILLKDTFDLLEFFFRELLHTYGHMPVTRCMLEQLGTRLRLACTIFRRGCCC